MIKLVNDYENDSGNIEVINGHITEDNTLGTAIFLSLYGGNIDDDGTTNDNKQWWGNENSETYRSRFQYQVRSFPVNIGAIPRIIQSIEADLSWIDNVQISIEMPSVSSIQITINVEQEEFVFTEGQQ